MLWSKIFCPVLMVCLQCGRSRSELLRRSWEETNPLQYFVWKISMDREFQSMVQHKCKERILFNFTSHFLFTFFPLLCMLLLPSGMLMYHMSWQKVRLWVSNICDAYSLVGICELFFYTWKQQGGGQETEKSCRQTPLHTSFLYFTLSVGDISWLLYFVRIYICIYV